MKTRRDFLKAVLGAALVVPAVAACRTIIPKAKPLLIDFETYPVPADPATLFAAMKRDPILYFKGKPIYPDGYEPVDFPHYETYLDEWKPWRYPGVKPVPIKEARARVSEYRATFPDHAIFPNYFNGKTGRWSS